MKRLISGFVLGVASLWLMGTACASSITSAQIVAATFKGMSNCIHYKVVGECLWWRCSTLECHMEMTLKLDHYLPDTVVSVYTQPDNNPWAFAKTVLDPVFYQAGKAQIQGMTHFQLGDSDEPENGTQDINNKFHEVDIIGNPALLFLKRWPFLLPSSAVAYVPYYS